MEINFLKKKMTELDPPWSRFRDVNTLMAALVGARQERSGECRFASSHTENDAIAAWNEECRRLEVDPDSNNLSRDYPKIRVYSNDYNIFHTYDGTLLHVKNHLYSDKVYEKISMRAYYIWKETGRTDELANWLQAEKEICGPC